MYNLRIFAAWGKVLDRSYPTLKGAKVAYSNSARAHGAHLGDITVSQVNSTVPSWSCDRHIVTYYAENYGNGWIVTVGV